MKEKERLFEHSSRLQTHFRLSQSESPETHKGANQKAESTSHSIAKQDVPMDTRQSSYRPPSPPTDSSATDTTSFPGSSSLRRAFSRVCKRFCPSVASVCSNCVPCPPGLISLFIHQFSLSKHLSLMGALITACHCFCTKSSLLL